MLYKLKLREAEDKISQLETKNEEQLKEINDLKHDLNKANRLVNKLDFKLWSEIKVYMANIFNHLFLGTKKN